jgi:elongator complex protein 4
MQSSVFIKKGKPVVQKANVNKQGIPLVRTGIPSLDKIFEGGLPVGSLVLIEEDPVVNHALQIARCFLGEGAVNNEKLFVYSEVQDEDLVPDIKRVRSDESANLRIAWRYESYPSARAVQGPYVFDLSKSRSAEIVRKAVSLNRREAFKKLFDELFSDIQESIQSMDDKLTRRILIKSMLGPAWPTCSHSELFQFFHSLKTLLRSLNAVCMITCPTYLLNPALKVMIQNISDMVLECRSFAETGDSYGEYSGLLRVIKLPRLLTIQPIDLDANCFGIRLDRRFISVEKLSVPPEESIAATKESIEF